MALLASQLETRLGRDAAPYVAALDGADDERLDAVGRAIAKHTYRAKLVAALDALGAPANGRARPRRPRR